MSEVTQYPMYIAHIRRYPQFRYPLRLKRPRRFRISQRLKSFHHIQQLSTHLENTAQKCAGFAAAFGMEEIGRLIGQLHDLGKYSEAFQRRIRYNTAKVDHSTAGGKLLLKAHPEHFTAWLSAYCIMGHHSGLMNGGSAADKAGESTLHSRLKKEIADYSAYIQDHIQIPQTLPIPAIKPLTPALHGFSTSFLIHMLFSCLVDADFLDTEAFMKSGGVKRDGYDSIEVLYERLKRYIAPFQNPSDQFNQKRTDILNNCLQAGAQQRGLYTLTVPTGGGKTISSLAFALRHAKEHGLRRVIYVIPYTSILEQNSSIFEKILGKQNVLAHYAGALYDKDEHDTGETSRKYLATENWDIPVVITTNVQFFESLFGARTSVCRKLHNIANSVLIFDEAQMLPPNYLLPCVYGIAELVQNYRCTAVLCTATQSALDTLLPPNMPCREICADPAGLYEFFRRTIVRHIGRLTDEQLADRLNDESQALCIVNSRKQAQKLYTLLKSKERFHLSTSMYPAHRRAVLETIRKRLDRKNPLPCRVVSTSLIEAGVDVDFPAVYRAEAGSDSLVQAAGRCNRENRNPRAESFVNIFQPDSEYRLPPGFSQMISAYQAVARHHEDISSLQAIRAYFEQLFYIKGKEALDKKEILPRLERGLFPFRKIAEDFRIIEEDTCQVLIPKEHAARQLLTRLQNGERSRGLFREVGLYCVSVRKNLLSEMLAAGYVAPLDQERSYTGGHMPDGIFVLTNEDAYDENTGLILEVPGGQSFFV